MKEEVIIDLKLERDDGDFAKLASLKQTLVNIKQDQANLNRAYKDGSITLKEFASETVRLEANQKKLSAAYNETQRKVTGLKNPFDKLNDSIKEQANQVNVAGISLSTFANPVTATVGLLGGLFKAYASSTIGAKDLEFASNQLGASFNYASNQLAGLISSAEDGEGFFSKLSAAFSAGVFGITNAIQGRAFAGFQEKLQDLGREELKIRTENNQRLEDNAVILAKLQESNIDIVEKQHLSGEAIINLRKNEEDLLGVKEQQLKVLETLLAMDKENEELQDAVKLKEQEIGVIKRDTERKVQNIIKLESNLLDVEKGKTAQAQKQDDLRQKKIREEEAAAKKKLDKSISTGIDKTTTANIGELGDDWVEHNKKLRAGEIKEQENFYKQTKALADKNDKDAADRAEKMADRTTALFANQINVYQQYLQDSNEIGKNLLKAFLINMLRMLKSALEARIIGESFATLDSILSFGITGAIRAAALVGIVEGAFSLAENAISGFADGGVVGRVTNQGKKIRRSNGDDRLVTVKTGEVVLNERHQRMLGGDDTFRKLGIPGFATSGLVTPSVNSQLPMDSQTMRLFRELSKRQVAVVIEDVERLMQSRANILEKATL